MSIQFPPKNHIFSHQAFKLYIDRNMFVCGRTKYRVFFQLNHEQCEC